MLLPDSFFKSSTFQRILFQREAVDSYDSEYRVLCQGKSQAKQ
ncbi:MAG: hypothetical protein ACO3MG_05350 [Saprospiraceae bacterium]